MNVQTVTLRPATPAESSTMGSGMTIRAGFHTSPFGDCLIGEMPQGICHLSFFEKSQTTASIAEMAAAWPNAEMVWDHDHSAQLGSEIFASCGPPPLRIFMRGTPFQIRIWRALLDIPFGTVSNYGMLAAAVGHPKASRATGSAVGKNEVSYLIPCHRIVRGDGHCGNYRWGATRKRAMLEWEARNTPIMPNDSKLPRSASFAHGDHTALQPGLFSGKDDPVTFQSGIRP